MKTLPEAFHPDRMDQTYFLNEDGNDEYTFVSTELKLKIKDAYNKAVNSEKYIQKLKLEMAQLMHIQEMKKTIREKKKTLVHAKACYLVRREKQKKKQEQEAAAEETDDDAEEAEEAEADGGGGDKDDQKNSSSEEEEDSSSSSDDSNDADDDFNIV